MRLTHLILIYSITQTLFLGLSVTVYGQDYVANIQHYSIEDGLSHREVFSIHQDSKGFIWLATKYGLNRFDGKFFKSWTKEKQGLAANEIHHILEDSEGWLWLFTGNNWFHSQYPSHCSLVNAYTGEVSSPKEKFGDKMPFQISDIAHYMVDDNGILFFTTQKNQLYSYHASEGFQLIPTSFNQLFFPQYRKGKGLLWGYTGKKRKLEAKELIGLDLNGKILQNKVLPEGSEFVHFFDQNDKGISYATYNNLYDPFLFTLSREGRDTALDYHAFSQHILSDREIGDWSRRIFYQPSKQFFWFKSYPNFFIFDTKKEVVFDFEKEHKKLIDADIHTLFFDKDDFIWVGTAYGLYKIELKNNPFKRLLYQNYEEYSISKAFSCRGIWVEEQNIWVNTYKGRRSFKDLTHSVQQIPYLSNPRNDEKYKYLLWTPLGVFRDKFKPAIWFSGGVLVRRDLTTQEEKPYFWDHSITDNPDIWTIYQDKESQVWVGTGVGIAKLDTQQNLLNYDKTLQSQMTKGYIHAFVERPDGKVWIATSSGLYLWLPDRGILNRYWTGGTDNFYLPHDNILHVHEDREGMLWLAAGGGGLIQLAIPPNHFSTNSSNLQKPNTPPPLGANSEKANTSAVGASKKHFQQFTTEDGLSNNNLYAVYGDDFENLWMSSDYGIIRFNKKTNHAKAYLPADGISHHEFNRTSHFQDKNGRIYFGGLNGLTIFDPKDLQEKSILEIPIMITNFQQLNGKSEALMDKTNELLKNRKITLQPEDRFFRLQFAMLDYQSPELTRFAWKIEGLGDNWNHINENFIQVIGLPYGNYLLKVKGQAGNGEWSQKELQLPIRVLKPFYLRTWFLGLLTIGLFSTMLIGYKWRTSQLKNREIQLQKLVNQRTATIKEQAKELQQLDDLKSRFFANISHELRTPLTLILGPIHNLMKTDYLKNKEFTLLNIIQQNGQNLLKLVNEILDLTKLESGKLHLIEEPLALYPFFRRLISSFESFAKKQKIKLVFEYQATPSLQVFLDKNKLEKIFNNLLSNALKYTPPKGKITVVFLDLGKALQLVISDTGRGIHPNDLPHIFDRFYQSKHPNAPNEGSTGIGLALVNEFVKLFGGNIKVTSKVGKGSTFTIQFPKKEAIKILETDDALEIQQWNAEENVGKLTSLNTATFGVQNQEVDANPIVMDQPTLLIVEDNTDLLFYMELILGEKYNILSAENGQAALQILTSLQKDATKVAAVLPALIISDLMMPIMDGYQFLERLKNNKTYATIPVIMLTAKVELRDKLKALRIGVDDYMNKPFIEEELLARVANLLKNAHARIQFQQEVLMLENPEAEAITASIKPEDLEWLKKVEQEVLLHFSDFDFSLEKLGQLLFLSPRQTRRRLKQLTGLTFSQYLKEIRLQEARRLLEDNEVMSIKALLYTLGMKDLRHFSQQFKQRFGKSPSAYLEEAN